MAIFHCCNTQATMAIQYYACNIGNPTRLAKIVYLDAILEFEFAAKKSMKIFKIPLLVMHFQLHHFYLVIGNYDNEMNTKINW